MEIEAGILGIAISLIAFIALLRKEKKGWSIFFVFLALGSCAFTFTQFGIVLGKVTTQSNFYANARRSLGQGLYYTAKQAKEGKNEIVAAKAIYLDKVWYDTDFFNEDGGDSLNDLFFVLMSSTAPKVQPGGGINSEAAPQSDTP